MYGPTDIPSLVPLRRNFRVIYPADNHVRHAQRGTDKSSSYSSSGPQSPAEGGGLDSRLLLSIGGIGGGVVGEFLVKVLVNGGLSGKRVAGQDVLKEISDYFIFVPSLEDEELICG
jgi:hypothetical protein